MDPKVEAGTDSRETTATTGRKVAALTTELGTVGSQGCWDQKEANLTIKLDSKDCWVTKDPLGGAPTVESAKEDSMGCWDHLVASLKLRSG